MSLANCLSRLNNPARLLQFFPDCFGRGVPGRYLCMHWRVHIPLLFLCSLLFVRRIAHVSRVIKKKFFLLAFTILFLSAVDKVGKKQCKQRAISCFISKVGNAICIKMKKEKCAIQKAPLSSEMVCIIGYSFLKITRWALASRPYTFLHLKSLLEKCSCFPQCPI